MPPVKPYNPNDTLEELLIFNGIVPIDATDDWLEQWVQWSIVRERIANEAQERGDLE